jgi:gliding motility-associated-like protein
MKSRSLHSIFRPVNSFLLRILMVFIFIIFSVVISYADIHTWVPATGGAWTTTTNWLPTGLPVAGDDIIINGDQSAVISAVPTLAINSLTVNGTCTLTGSGGGTTLTIGGAAGTDFIVSVGKTLTLGTNLNITLAGNSTANINGTLNVSTGRTFNTSGSGVITIVNGVIVATGNVVSTAVTGLVFQNGSTYNHAMNGGTVPTADWADGSTCMVTGVVATPPAAVSLGQNFYNLTWNNPSQTWNPTAGSGVAGSDYKIRGTFTFASSGSGSNIWPSLNCTVTNYVHTGGIDRLAYSAPITHSVGNFSVSGGTVDITQSTGTSIINISGNVSVSGGLFTLSGSGNATINFVGVDVQTFTSGGTISGPLFWIIQGGSTVDFGSSVLSGSTSSTFTLSALGNIITDNPNGLTLGGSTGSIQVGGTRTYNPGANYTYNGSSAQETGNGLSEAAILTINNTAGVTLSGNLLINGTLNFISGIITTGTNTVIMNLTATISGADLGNYVFGNLLWNIDTGPQIITFEIGDAVKYTPVRVVFNNVTTPGTLTGSSHGNTHPDLLLSPISSTKYVKRYYTLTSAGLAFNSANVTLNWSISDIQGFANYTKFIVGLYNSGWTTTSFSGRSSNSIQATGITVFGDFQVGESFCLEPVITVLPVDQSITYGANAIFSITATGTGLSYKWQEDRGSGFTNISDGGIYSNSTTPALNITKPTGSVSGYKYRCVITGLCGTATSNGNATLIVNKKVLTVTAVNKTKEYDGAIFPPENYTIAYSGFITGEDETVLSGTPGFTGTALTAFNAGDYLIIPAGLTSLNYEITYVNGTLNITKKGLTVTAVDKTKEYDGVVFPGSNFTVIYSGFIAGENETTSISGTIAFTGSAITAINNGTYVITPGNLISVNYYFTYVNGSLHITKKALTATADDKSRAFGEANPTLTISYTGLVSGDNAASITQPTISTTAVAGSPTGTYPITLSGGSAANYELSLVNGVLTVNKATATIILGNLTATYNGTAKTASATTSPAGLTVNLTYNGSLTAPVNAGTYTVVGTISNSNYQGSASGNLIIEKASQTITFNDIPDGLRITQMHELVTSASSGLAVTLVSSNSNIASISGSTLTINKDGTVTITGSQAGNSNWSPAADVSNTIVTLPTFDNINSLFTPNNDGMNDYWYIPGLEEYGKVQVTVYNRFGQAVYKSDDYANDWDGTWNGNPLPPASYYYIMKSSIKGTIKGVVNIIR